VIYISRGKNMREKVLQLFATDNASLIPGELRDSVVDISYELTGNDLVASLLEAAEIQRCAPGFNAVPRMRQFSHGLYSAFDEQGYITLFPDSLLEETSRPILKFTSRLRAERMLDRIYAAQEIAPYKKGVDSPQVYNQKVDKILTKYLYPYPNFLIVDMGRSGEERSVVWIQDEDVRGYGYFDPQYTGAHVNSILDVIKPIEETSEMRKMIIEYVRKNARVLDIIPLDG
jgi:DNA polymerase III subunit epsilon